MAQKRPQTLANHRRIVFGYHVVALLLLAVNAGWWIYQTITAFSATNLVALLLAIALVLIGLYTRVFALGAQDRVIRLEERLRYARVLPEDMQQLAETLSLNQVIALRFASDHELPTLMRTVTEKNLQHRGEIKKLITTWKPDYQRL